MIKIILRLAVLGDGWVLADASTLQRTRTNTTGTYTERMTAIGMPMGVFDELGKAGARIGCEWFARAYESHYFSHAVFLLQIM